MQKLMKITMGLVLAGSLGGCSEWKSGHYCNKKQSKQLVVSNNWMGGHDITDCYTIIGGCETTRTTMLGNIVKQTLPITYKIAGNVVFSDDGIKSESGESIGNPIKFKMEYCE